MVQHEGTTHIIKSNKKLIDKRYFYLRNNPLLGKSQLGKIVRGYSVLNPEIMYAIKVVKKSGKFQSNPIYKELLWGEINLLKILKGNPYIVQIVESLETMNHTYIILELIDGGNLKNQIKERDTNFYSRNPIKEALSIGFQICLGIGALHKVSIAHRDIKPSCILYSVKDQHLKLCGLGFAKQFQEEDKTKLGTIPYMAPEYFKSGIKKTHKIDIWAYGCQLIELFYGIQFFKAKTKEETIDNIQNKKILLPKNPKLNVEVQNLLIGCLTRDIDDRLDYRQVMHHPAFDFCRNEYMDNIIEEVLQESILDELEYQPED